MRRRGQAGLLGAVLVGALVAATPLSCSSSAKLAGAGGACVLATDCQDGLICCNQGNATNTCMATTMCLLPMGGNGMEGGGPPSMMAQGDGAVGDTGVAPRSDASQQDMDTGTPDTGTSPPPNDSGKPEDTGTPPQEAGPPPPPPDAGAE